MRRRRPRAAYCQPVRDEQAGGPSAGSVDAAYELFLEHGYPATTDRRRRRRAGVSAQTVYNAFGTKAALLKRVYDVRLVGDDEPVPLGQRPEVVAALRRPRPGVFLRCVRAISADGCCERLGPFCSS